MVIDSRVILVKPLVDASDKELHKRNGMLNAQENLAKYLREEKAQNEDKISFVPNKLGQLSKHDRGVKKNVLNLKRDNIDLNKDISLESINEILAKLKKLD